MEFLDEKRVNGVGRATQIATLFFGQILSESPSESCGVYQWWRVRATGDIGACLSNHFFPIEAVMFPSPDRKGVGCAAEIPLP